jgi:methyl acetate hydrolase
MKKIAALAILLSGAVCASLVVSLGASRVASFGAGSAADLDALLRTAVEQKRVPLVVAMVADARGVVYEHATGVPKDAIFAIASMTKPVTSVAVMQLVEAGKLKLDEPASTYVQELRNVRVLDGGKLRPPKTPVTVRQLLTHTSGFGYEFSSPELAALVGRKEMPSMMAGGDGFLQAPLLSDPGTRWEYGISIDWLGRIVERVSGQSLDAYFRDRIFQPLGMTDSFFVVPANKQSRIAPRFQRTETGALTEQPAQPAPPVTFFSGGGGLFSTAADYMRFVRAMMAGGELDKRRILSKASVTAMGSNQIGALTLNPVRSLIPMFIVDSAVMPGSLDKFGLGFALNSRPAGGRAANTMAWAGVYNTFFWIDRDKQIGGVFLTHMLPAMDPGPQKVLEEFDRAVYAWKKTGTTPGAMP